MPNTIAHRVTTVALSLQSTLTHQLETVAYNLANATTSGFKAVVPNLIEQRQSSAGNQSVSYVKTTPPTRDFRDGSYRQTGNPFDLAIHGEGFFKLSNDHLTRNGQFQVTVEGKIVTPSGQTLMGDGGEITIPPTAKYVSIAEDGTVTTDKGKVGKIGIFKVQDLKNLVFSPDGNFISKEEPVIVDKPAVFQGFVEESNVSPIEQTIKLIEITRLFQQAQKFIEDQAKRVSQVMNITSGNAV